MTLAGKTLLMSGGSRGIGLAIAVAAASRGANVTLLAKTATADSRIPGTIHTAVEAVEQAGGRAIGVVGDVRSADDVSRAVAEAVEAFGGIDIVVNNASAIALTSSLDTDHKKFDLLQDVNSRGTWLLTTTALPFLLKSDDARVLTLSPPLNLSPRWLGAHPAYLLSKYGMTLLTLGWSYEYDRIAATCLWPETLIDTAAVRNIVGGADHARSPQIMADAAMAVLEASAPSVSGRTLIDVEALRLAGVTDLSAYGSGDAFVKDIFVD